MLEIFSLWCAGFGWSHFFFEDINFAVSTIVISALFLGTPLCYRRKAEVWSLFVISEPYPLVCFGNFPQTNTKFCTYLKDTGNFKLTFQFMLQHFSQVIFKVSNFQGIAKNKAWNWLSFLFFEYWCTGTLNFFQIEAGGIGCFTAKYGTIILL